MTNMCNAHTLSIGGLNLILPLVALPHGELVKIIGEVVRRRRIRIPGRIYRVGWSGTIGGVVGGGHGQGGKLTILVSPIIASTEEIRCISLEATCPILLQI